MKTASAKSETSKPPHGGARPGSGRPSNALTSVEIRFLRELMASSYYSKHQVGLDDKLARLLARADEREFAALR